jgi:predicted nucleotide-binding protein (sugar kinase/HSP70/actin superfamily)
MKENFEFNNYENIRLNIQLSKIDSVKQADMSESVSLDRKKSKKTEIQKQVLKGEDIQFEKLPIQKLFPVPFVNCIKSFSRIECWDDLVFIDLKMEKKWMDFLIDRIQNSDKNHENLMSNPYHNETQINIDISEIDDSKIYSVYTDKNVFRLTFSDRYLNVNLVCGVDSLKEYQGDEIKDVHQKQLKKGLLNYILKKWSN